jgi:hypothetical protein
VSRGWRRWRPARTRAWRWRWGRRCRTWPAVRAAAFRGAAAYHGAGASTAEVCAWWQKNEADLRRRAKLLPQWPLEERRPDRPRARPVAVRPLPSVSCMPRSRSDLRVPSRRRGCARLQRRPHPVARRPASGRGARALVDSGALADAVRRESNQAVAYWWVITPPPDVTGEYEAGDRASQQATPPRIHWPQARGKQGMPVSDGGSVGGRWETDSAGTECRRRPRQDAPGVSRSLRRPGRRGPSRLIYRWRWGGGRAGRTWVESAQGLAPGLPDHPEAGGRQERLESRLRKPLAVSRGTVGAAHFSLDTAPAGAYARGLSPGEDT